MGVVARNALSFSKASYTSVIQVNWPVFFRSLYSGMPCYPSREMNQLREARHPMSFWTPFRFMMGPRFSIVVIFSEFALMPYSKMMNPRSFPLGIPKMHFLGLSLILDSLRRVKAASRLLTS